MIDRTSVGISPLLSTPVTSTFVSTPEVIPGAVTYGTSTFPGATTQVLDSGLALPGTTTTLLPDATTSYLPEATTTLLPDATTSYLPEATTTLLPDATTSYLPATTTLLPDATTSYLTGATPLVTDATPLATDAFVPQIGLPDQALTSIVPDVVPTVVPTPEVSVLPTAVPSVVTPPPVTSTVVSSFVDPNTSIVPAPVLGAAAATPVPPPVPQNPPIGPIMDEDFQRGRPIYDEFSEDRYRGFRLGR